VGEDDGESDTDIEARGGRVGLELSKLSVRADKLLRTCMLGRPSRSAGTMGIDAENEVESIVVVLVLATTRVEVEVLFVVLEPFLALVKMGVLGREPDGREGTGGMEPVSGFIGRGTSFTPSSDPNSIGPNLLSCLENCKYGSGVGEDELVLTPAVTLDFVSVRGSYGGGAN
jgi:hypothetical protein